MTNSSESDTASVDSLYLKTISLHDRQFQQYAVENLVNLVPVDENEQIRLDAQHQFVLNFIFDGRLIFPPVPSPEKVLDCGYGSGSWAMDVAEQYPDCEVTGVDISPHMRPDDIPENLSLQLDDLNRPFTFRADTFDLIQSRFVGHGINRTRWPSYVRDIHRVTKPGGWVQLVEIYYNCQSDNGSLTDSHALRQWSGKMLSSIEDIKDPRVPLRLGSMMNSAGFVEAQSRMIPLPLCGWSRDPRNLEIGRMYSGNVRGMLESLALYPFSERLGMTLGEITSLVSQACTEANDESLKAYFPMYVCIGRKPLRS